MRTLIFFLAIASVTACAVLVWVGGRSRSTRIDQAVDEGVSGAPEDQAADFDHEATRSSREPIDVPGKDKASIASGDSPPDAIDVLFVSPGPIPNELSYSLNGVVPPFEAIEPQLRHLVITAGTANFASFRSLCDDSLEKLHPKYFAEPGTPAYEELKFLAAEHAQNLAKLSERHALACLNYRIAVWEGRLFDAYAHGDTPPPDWGTRLHSTYSTQGGWHLEFAWQRGVHPEYDEVMLEYESLLSEVRLQANAIRRSY